jgi:hypothetical protein
MKRQNKRILNGFASEVVNYKAEEVKAAQKGNKQ